MSIFSAPSSPCGMDATNVGDAELPFLNASAAPGVLFLPSSSPGGSLDLSMLLTTFLPALNIGGEGEGKGGTVLPTSGLSLSPLPSTPAPAGTGASPDESPSEEEQNEPGGQSPSEDENKGGGPVGWRIIAGG